MDLFCVLLAEAKRAIMHYLDIPCSQNYGMIDGSINSICKPTRYG